MVKIKDLTNQELLEKIERYIVTYNKLESERQRRLEKFGELEELLTEEEKSFYAKQKTEAAPKQNQQDEGTNTNTYRIDFDEIELKRIQDTCDQQISDSEKLQTITKILNLADIDLDGDDGDNN